MSEIQGTLIGLVVFVFIGMVAFGLLVDYIDRRDGK